MYSMKMQSNFLIAFLVQNILWNTIQRTTQYAVNALRWSWLATFEAYQAMVRSLKGAGIIPDNLPTNRLTNISFIGAAIGVIIVIFVISALVGPVSNFTTGITIAHTGFTPNSNVTGSPGTVPLLQLYPLFFVIFGLLVIVKYVQGESHGL